MRVILLACALLLAGCLGPTETQQSASTPDLKDAKAACQIGDITVEPEATGFVARQTVVCTNSDRGASTLVVDFATENGDVALEGSARDDYEITVELRGRGSSEASARQQLESMSVSHGDSLEGRVLSIATTVEFAPAPQGSGIADLLPGATTSRSADLQAALPAHPTSGEARTTNGDVTVEADGGDFVASTTNGDVAFDGRFSAFNARTTNGDIDAAGSFGDLTMAATNGGIDGEVSFFESGNVDASMTNGDIDLQVTTGPRQGFDIIASTTNGDIEIDVEETQPVVDEDDHKHYRTAGFDDRAVQTHIEADTTNGSVDIIS